MPPMHDQQEVCPAERTAPTNSRALLLFLSFATVDTLNNVLNGVWQPTTLDRAHLERILSGSRQPTAGARANSQPINLAHVVTEWNDGLLKMQSVLAQYVQRQQGERAQDRNATSSARRFAQNQGCSFNLRVCLCNSIPQPVLTTLRRRMSLASPRRARLWSLI